MTEIFPIKCHQTRKSQIKATVPKKRPRLFSIIKAKYTTPHPTEFNMQSPLYKKTLLLFKAITQLSPHFPSLEAVVFLY